MSTDRGQFSSKLGFILAAAGSAVGLGNLVAFPVVASKNGGAVFLVVYVLFVVLICLPVMMAEIAMGRASQRNPVGAFSALSGGDWRWKMAGRLAILTPFMISVFYTVLTVWILMYLVVSMTGGLERLAQPDTFGTIVASPSVFLYLLGLQIVVLWVILRGVRNGIERQARILMPTLATMLIGLVIFVMMLDNASTGLRYYLIPDFSRLNASVFSAALNQAFFSLSLGMGIMITYGSYLSREENIVSSTRLVAVADTSVAFMAGLLILPAIWVFDPGTNPDDLSTSSVGLIFTYLPQILLSLQETVGYVGASLVSSVFFALVLFAAFTSLVSIVEIPISYLIDEWKLSRNHAVMVMGSAMTLCAVAAATSFGMSDFFTHFVSYGGGQRSFFDLLADTFSEVILPFVGFLACVLCAWRWRRDGGLHGELEIGYPHYRRSFTERYVNFSLRTFIPVVLLFVFFNSVALKYFAFDLLSLL